MTSVMATLFRRGHGGSHEAFPLTIGDVMKTETIIEAVLAVACWLFVGGLSALCFI